MTLADVAKDLAELEAESKEKENNSWHSLDIKHLTF
jgi:hypothetical protein